MNAQHLIARYRAGQPYALDPLIEESRLPLYRFCYHLTRSRADADDLFQEAWLKAVRYLDRYRSDKPFLPWMFTITLNTYRDRYRSRARWAAKVKAFFSEEAHERAMTGVPDPNSQPEEHLLEQEMSERLAECLHSLDDKFRVPLILYYYKEFSYEEIADMLGVPIGTVRSRLNTAKLKLKERMRK